MFTGLVEELGQVKSRQSQENSARLTIAAQKILLDAEIGDSIAVNGVCLTVVALGKNYFQADVMWETLKRSNLGDLKTGDQVNLERALKMGDRLGGHLVSGHIDGVGGILSAKQVGIATLLEISAPPQVEKYLLEKGSIAMDGISLTVVEVKKGSFTVSLIPHSAQVTTLGLKKVGDQVNLEGDMIGKYVERLMTYPGNMEKKKHEYEQKKSNISWDFLQEKGFM